MAKGKVYIQGIYPQWRKGKDFDAYRVCVRKSGTDTAQVQISAKLQPTLRQINQYLKSQKLREGQAEEDPFFYTLKNRLFEELGKEYSLKTYHAQEELDLKRKRFDFGVSLDEFVAYKSDQSIPYAYKSYVLNFWFPFFFAKGCEHPNEFGRWKMQAKDHVKTALTIHGKKYSPESYHALTTPLNEYMKFLKEYGYITEEDVFKIVVKKTLEQKKQAKRRGEAVKTVRGNDVYTLEDLFVIKNRIDQTYASDKKMKLRAYAMYFGLCTGLRRGNILGIMPSHFHPENMVPFFNVGDDVVRGWSRGEKGILIFPNSTKTTSGEDIIELPLLQPSKEVLVEVVTFLKNNLGPEEYILQCSPDTVADWWKEIANECGFRFLSCHRWKHSYATIGALHLGDWYKGNPILLQICCLHSDIRTTQKYLKSISGQVLMAFK